MLLLDKTGKRNMTRLLPLRSLHTLIRVCLVAQLCLTLYDPMDCSLPGSSVHGDLQARILEWVAMPSSRGSSYSRDQTQVSCIAGGFFTIWATREAQEYWSRYPILSPGYLPDPGIKPESPALQAIFLPAELPGTPTGEETEEERVIVSLGCINIL